MTAHRATSQPSHRGAGRPGTRTGESSPEPTTGDGELFETLSMADGRLCAARVNRPAAFSCPVRHALTDQARRPRHPLLTGSCHSPGGENMRALRSTYGAVVRVGCVAFALAAPAFVVAQDTAPATPPAEAEQ